MKRTILIGVVIFFHTVLISQISDKLWLGGFNEFPGQPGFAQFQIYFGTNGPIVEAQPLAFNFESTVAVAADKFGNLLFYSNGCEVANRNHQLMPNGDKLPVSSISDLVCPWKGYMAPQGAMVLPWPADSTRYCLLHMNADYEPRRKLQLGPLFYSVIDMTLDGGLGDVVEKRTPLVTGDLTGFTAIRHGNGRDWWIITPLYYNRLWQRRLLTPQGMINYPIQQLPYLLPACEHYGQIAVNKTGDRIAIWGDCKIMVWNFDRCSGDITGPKEYPTPAHWFYGGGVAFSNSGRYLYATDQVSLQRIDLEGPLGPLDTMRLSFNPYDPDGEDIRQVPGNSFHYLFLAPDGYIYGTVASRGRYFHLLKENDGAGIADIDFLPKGLPLPGINVRSIPHFPNFKLADMPESLCDTLGINMETNALDEIEIAELKLYPNPAQDQIRLFWQNDMEEQGFYQIFASTGALLLSGNLQGIGADGVDIHTIPPGLYAFQLNHKQGIHVTLFVKE